MSTSLTLCLSRLALAAPAALLITVSGASAQSGETSPKAPVKVAMLDLAFYGKRANDLFPGDTAMASTATSVMRKGLTGQPGITFVDSATVAKTAAGP
jgi:hypothetical protein